MRSLCDDDGSRERAIHFIQVVAARWLSLESSINRLYLILSTGNLSTLG